MLVYGLFLISISSCKKDVSTQIESSVIKDKTIAWMISKKTNVTSLQSATIDSVVKNLNWDVVSFDQINDNLKSVFIPVYSNEIKGLTVLYNASNQSIDTGNLVLIKSIDAKDPINHINIYNPNLPPNFTGTISVFSVHNEFESKLGVVNGRKIYKAEIRSKKYKETIENKNLNKKTNNIECIEHYLVTTYNDGSQDWIFLGQTCSNSIGCETTTINQIANESFIKISSCTGGGSGPGTPGYAEAIYDAELQAFEKYYRDKMSELEKDIFDNEMNFVQKVYYLKNAQLAKIAAEAQFPTSLYNGKGDAYRHALFVAMNAKDLGPDLAKRMADAHELRIVQGEFLSPEMDKRNNLIGISIYDYLKTLPIDYTSYVGMLHVLINEKLENGDFWIISNLDPYGKETNLSQLIKSNEKQ